MNVIFFDEPGADDVKICGGKGASLGKLATTGAVPPGFNLPVDAYREWVESGANNMPQSLAKLIESAYERLEEITGIAQVPVAVRSSAADEDGSDDSFAGLHDTYLNIHGADAITDAVIKCWKSLTSERALEYRAERGLNTSEPLMGVVVQQLVVADASAVAFSANPVSGDRDEILINANYGLGEAVVSGITTPDTIVVAKSDTSKQTLTIGTKEVMTVRTEQGTEEKNVPRIMRDQPALSPEQVAEIARMAITLENQYGWPVDLECAIESSQLYLLQCRPITTL